MTTNTIEPVSNVWINCYINNIFSIITTIEPSYRNLLYENSYFYRFFGRCKWFKSLSVGNYKLYKYCDLINVFVAKINENDVINEIKNLIDNGNAVLIKVDLYNWLPDGIDYQKRHVYHEALIVEYNDENQTLQILDDDVYGYRKHCISYEFLLNSLKHLSFDKMRYINIPNRLPKYEYNIKNILENTYRLLNSILSVRYSSLWNTYNNCEQIIDLVTESTKIVERQKANRYFFGDLKHENFISDISYDYYICILDECEKIWQKIKAILLKSFITGAKANYIKLNNLSYRALNYEKELWIRFIKELSNYE